MPGYIFQIAKINTKNVRKTKTKKTQKSHPLHDLVIEVRTRRPHGPDAEPVPDEGKKRSRGHHVRLSLHIRPKICLKPEFRPAREQGTRVFFAVVQNERWRVFIVVGSFFVCSGSVFDGSILSSVSVSGRCGFRPVRFPTSSVFERFGSIGFGWIRFR